MSLERYGFPLLSALGAPAFVILLRLQTIESFANILLFGSAVTFALYTFIRPPDIHAGANSIGTMWGIVFTWLVHSALFRRADTQWLSEDMAFGFGVVAALLGSLSNVEILTCTLNRTVVFAFLLTLVNVVPHAEQNAFSADIYHIQFRLAFFLCLYWLNTYNTIWRQREKLEGDVADMLQMQRLLMLRDIIRVIWILFIPESGILVVIFVGCLQLTMECVWQTSMYKSLNTDDVEVRMDIPAVTRVVNIDASNVQYDFKHPSNTIGSHVSVFSQLPLK